VRANARESGETVAARTVPLEARARVVAEYRYVRTRLEGQLLNPAPDAPVSPAVLEQIERTLGRLLPERPSDFPKVGMGRQSVIIDEAVEAARTDDGVRADLGEGADFLIARLDPAGEVFDAAQAVVRNEVVEDREATEALGVARAALDRAAEVHAHEIEGALAQSGRKSIIGRYLLARDPAYRARRNAGRPVTEEQGVSDITTEIGVPEAVVVEPLVEA